MRNKPILISTIALVACLAMNCGVAFAQDWKKLGELLDKETTPELSNKPNFKNVHILSYYPDTLPTWFFTLPYDKGVYYSIGISDPDMEVDEAKKLALHRAKSMAVLLSNCKVQYIRDVYSSVDDKVRYADVRGRFDTFFKVSSSKQVSNSMFQVVDTHLTRYNEYLVLLKYTPTSNMEFSVQEGTAVSNVNVVGTSFIVEASVGGAFETQAEYEFASYDRGLDAQQKGKFVYNEKDNRFLTMSSFNDERIEFPLYSYIYASPAWKNTRSPFASYSGLWSTYMRQFMNFLSISCENSTVKMKNTDQKYGSEMLNLTREVASFLGELRVNGISFDSDTLKIELNILETQRLIK